MHSALPIILVLLALFTAGCIAYAAWELSSSDKRVQDPPDSDDKAEDLD